MSCNCGQVAKKETSSKQVTKRTPTKNTITARRKIKRPLR